MAKRRTLRVQKAEKPPMERSKIAALISVYDSSKWLRHRLENLFDTDIYKRGELFIFAVNCQSPDPEDNLICESYAGKNKFHYEVIDKCTVYSAWAYMVNKTTTPFLTNANTDDLVSPRYYDEMLHVLENKKASLAYADWITIGEGVVNWRSVAGMAGGNASYFNPDADLMGCSHMPVWRRSLHDRVGNFDGWFQAMGDLDFWNRAWINGIRDFAFVNSPLTAYRWRDGQNLWHRVPESQHTEEWTKLRGRKPGKLEL